MRFNAQKAIEAGYSPEEVQAYLTQSQPKKKDRGLLDLLSTATSIGGGVLGSAVAPGVGTVGGAAAGGALGEWLEQLISKDETDLGDIGSEALWGGGGALVGMGVGKLLGGGAKGVSKELARGKLAKNLPKDTATGKVDELVDYASQKGMPRGSSVAKSRGYEELATELRSARGTEMLGITQKIPRDQFVKQVKDAALKSGWIDESEAKGLDKILGRLDKGKDIQPDKLLNWIEDLSDAANLASRQANPSVSARASKALRDAGGQVLEGYLPKGSQAQALTKELGQALSLSEGYGSAARAGVNLPTPFGGSVNVGPLARPVEAGADLLGRLGVGGVGSPVAQQAIGQAGARAFRPEEYDPQQQSPITPEVLTGEVVPQEQSSQRQMVELLKQAAIADLMQGGKNITEIKAVIDLLSPEADEGAAKKQALTQSLALLVQNLEAAGGSQGAGGLVQSFFGKTPGVRALGIAPQAQVFEDQRRSMIAPLARAISGEVGVLTDQDIARAEGLLPRLSDPPEVAAQKIRDLQMLLNQAGTAGTPDAQILHAQPL